VQQGTGAPIESACQLKAMLAEASRAFYNALNRSTLAQQMKESEELYHMLGIQTAAEV